MNEDRADVYNATLQHHLVRGAWVAFLSGLAALALTVIVVA